MAVLCFCCSLLLCCRYAVPCGVENVGQRTTRLLMLVLMLMLEMRLGFWRRLRASTWLVRVRMMPGLGLSSVQQSTHTTIGMWIGRTV